MGALDQGRVRSPACRFEGGRAEEVLVDGDESLSDTVGNFGQIACAELVRNQTVFMYRSGQRVFTCQLFYAEEDHTVSTTRTLLPE